MIKRAVRYLAVSVPALLALAAPPRCSAASFADAKFTETVIATNLNPTAMAIAPDGRIFVCNKNGPLRVIKNGALVAKPFVTVPAITASEQGLVGVTLHPKFPDSPFVYVFYTLTGPEHNRVSRFRADGDTAAGGIGGETIIFEMEPTTAGNHNGGAIHFGNDGKLYISSGNSASSAFSLSMATTLGKILRVNPDGTIPSDNPFMAQTTGKAQAIWCSGMRNTFTFDVDKVTGRIFGAEVGDGWEEVNELMAGSNYGYGRQEGYTVPTNTTGIVGTFRPAIYTYDGGGCIIAAAFYPASAIRNFPEAFHRKFFFADYRNNDMKVLDIDNPKTVAPFATNAMSPVDIKFGADGVMYYLNRGQNGGALLKVTYAGGPGSLAGAAKGLAAPAGWRMWVNQQGRMPWSSESGALEIMGMDGRISVVDRGRKGVDGVGLFPEGFRNGVYFVRSK